MPVGPIQIAGVLIGASIALAGLWILVALRPSKSARGLRIPGFGSDHRASEPTRLFCALLLLIVGYHAAVWVFPDSLTNVQLDRNRWYVWIPIGMICFAFSLLIDRIEQKRRSDGDTKA